MNRRVIDRLKELALGEYDMPADASVDMDHGLHNAVHQKDGFDWSREGVQVKRYNQFFLE